MDLHASALTGFNRIRQSYLQDLQALSTDAFDKIFGEKTRSVADITYEVNLVNDHVGSLLRGEETFEWPDGWVKAPEDYRSKDAVIAGFEASSQRIVDLINSYSSADMDVAEMTEHGERTRYQRFQFLTLHMWYHSGQLNFIQTLIGDDQWHWE
ncbi:MAG: hypothetical protein HONBIEJF_00398 [Fimbriimonadaceae bacterium]|nr:hypothetical protein [Fimbriimonadaceae bacterium]